MVAATVEQAIVEHGIGVAMRTNAHVLLAEILHFCVKRYRLLQGKVSVLLLWDMKRRRCQGH